MITILIAFHFVIVLALVVLVLLQRSEGGALGIGGSNAFGAARGRADPLARMTAFLVGFFFLSSFGLTILVQKASGPASILDNPPPAGSFSVPGKSKEDLSDQPSVPTAPAPPVSSVLSPSDGSVSGKDEKGESPSPSSGPAPQIPTSQTQRPTPPPSKGKGEEPQ